MKLAQKVEWYSLKVCRLAFLLLLAMAVSYADTNGSSNLSNLNVSNIFVTNVSISNLPANPPPNTNAGLTDVLWNAVNGSLLVLASQYGWITVLVVVGVIMAFTVLLVIKIIKSLLAAFLGIIVTLVLFLGLFVLAHGLGIV